MTLFLHILLLLAVAVAGWLVLRLCRSPIPAFLGPLLCAGGLNYAYLYPDVSMDVPSFLSKALIGITIGCRLDRGSLATLRTLPGPAALTAAWMIGASLVAGYALFGMSDMTLLEALIGSAAGGVTEMIVFAMALGTNVVTVAFVQLFRLVFVITSIPIIAKIWLWRLQRQAGGTRAEKGTSTLVRAVENTPRSSTQGVFTRWWYVLLGVGGLAGGVLGEWLGIPAGAMLGAMLGSGIVVMGSGRDCPLPSSVSTIAQFGLGIVVAQGLSHDTIMALGGLIGPLLAPTFILLALCLLLSYVLTRLTGWDSMTCLLATMPAGLTQIVPIAEECGADVLKVAILHAVRLVAIVAILPWIIRMLV